MLSEALEAALLRELRGVYDNENWARFGSRLKPAVLALSDATSRLGCWDARRRTIELSRSLVLDRSWPEVVSVLQHEMAHGETFRGLCDRLGIDGVAAGAPVPAEGAPEIDRVLDKVRKLLALAGSANQHEAEIAMQRAHELMLRHNVETAGARGFEVRHVGDPERRISAVESAIVVLLTDCFFVKAIRIPVYLPRLGKSGAVHELSGSRANLELAVHVYAFLGDTAERLWLANRGDRRVKSGRDRLAYQTGVIQGFHDKLRGERETLAGTGLVWLGDAGLDEFYRRRHPRIRTTRSTARLTGAHDAGREAGQRVVLHRPVESRGVGNSPRLLRG
jgi:hypothetical protein